MGSIEPAVMRLLKAMEACRRSLDETAHSLRLIDAAGRTMNGGARLQVAHGAVKGITATAEVLVAPAPSEDAAIDRLSRMGHNWLGLSTGVEVSETGFQVVAKVNASIGWPMGATAVGWHDFYQYRSDAVAFDEATVEALAQTAILAGLDTYRSALGLVAAQGRPPSSIAGP